LSNRLRVRGTDAHKSTLSLCFMQLGAPYSPDFSSTSGSYRLSRLRGNSGISDPSNAKTYHSRSANSQHVPRGITGLHLAAFFGIEEAIKVILLKRVEVDSKDGGGKSPLLWAAQNGHEAVAKLLLGTGEVEVDLKDVYGRGQTPLSHAAYNGHEAVVKLLLGTGEIEVDSKDNYGRTPLLYAAQNGHEAVVKLLLETGEVEVYSKGEDVRTPLSWATGNGHDAIVKLLLGTGEIDVESKDEDSRMSLSYAPENGHDVVVKLLSTPAISTISVS